METTQLKKVKENAKLFHDRVVSNGGTLTTYKCNHCEQKIECVQPTTAQVTDKGHWDGLKTCTNCGGLNFVKTWPTGKTKSIKVDAN